MNLNENSTSAKLYRWFYDKNKRQMPTNLCPYFWQLVVMWIFILPVAILSLPANIGFFFSKDEKWCAKEQNFLMGFVIWLILWLISCVLIFIGGFFFVYQENSYLYSSMVVGFFVLLISIMLIGFHFIDKYKERKRHKEKQPNIIKEFVKAKYNKLCPTITWDKTE
jgi:hypothetical protein